MTIENVEKYILIVIVFTIIVAGFSVNARVEAKNESRFLSEITRNLGFASFRADTSNLERIKKHSLEHYQEITEMKWVIRGDTVKFGEAAIKVSIDKNRVDTVLYWSSADVIIPDSIICYISQPYDYDFRWNSCCGGFDVIDELNDKRYTAIMKFRLHKEHQTQEFLGKIDSAGTRIYKEFGNAIEATCRSAMLPNVCSVQIEEIRACKASDSCARLPCYKNEGEQPDSLEYSYYHPYYSVRERKTFSYMPLSSDTVEVTFNPDNNKILFFY